MAGAAEVANTEQGQLPGSGVLALTALTAFEYVTSRGDDTARRLVSPEIGRFITEALRTDALMLGPIRVAQLASVVGVALALVGVPLLLRRVRATA